MTYQNQGYGGQNVGYHAGQDSSWGSNNYGATQATTSRAAQALHNMSNNSYTANTTSSSQPSSTATHLGTNQASRYGSDSTTSPQMQTQQPHTAYGQSQARPRSVNTSRAQATTSRGLPSPATTASHPSQRTHKLSGQQQRSNSPANYQYNSGATAQASAARTAPMATTTSQQYTDYDRRQLASADTARGNQATPPATYKYPNTQTVAPPGPIAPPPSSIPEPYLNPGSTTVAPTAVYDPWPEYQHKAEAIRAQRAAEDAAHAEEERLAEEKHQAEEAKKAEAERAEAEKAQAAASQSKRKAKTTSGQPMAEDDSALSEAPPLNENPLEAEIRAIMAKMRELNGKDPALLARIWEEERRAKNSPKSPTVQSKTTAQPATVTPSASTKSSAPTANQKKKAVGIDSRQASSVKLATPVPAPSPAPVSTPMAAPSNVVRQQAYAPHRPAGNTIWPPEKKAALAVAASSYLVAQNSNCHVCPDQIVAMLNSNPSYIELCVLLEQMGLKLDRAAFAKNLLSQVPEVSSSARKMTTQPVPPPASRPAAPAAVLKKEVSTPASHPSAFAAATPAYHSPYTTFSGNVPPTAPAPVAEMVPIKAELKPPANKEEAARKRSLSDLVDLTQLSEDEDMGPPLKKPNTNPSFAPDAHPDLVREMDVDGESPMYRVDNLSSSAVVMHVPLPDTLTKRPIVQPLDKKKALRRNNYNPATIARDVLLACGRHPHERQLNQHLELLRLYLPNVQLDSDLSTLDWAVIDPGKPPRGYFKDSLQTSEEDADDEDDYEDKESKTHARGQSNGESGAQARVQALPEATNPFQQRKRKGRSPRQSLPNDGTPATPKSSTPKPTTKMTSSVPREATSTVGYSAFRQYGPDGQLLPKKRGRPVGWRKAIHGSPTAQAHPQPNKFTAAKGQQPSQSTPLCNAQNGNDEPIRIDSRSPSVSRTPQYQSFKCRWKNCPADLHNLETLKKHIFKVHRVAANGNVLPCLWADCGDGPSQHPDSKTNMDGAHVFEFDRDWHDHIQKSHIDPLSWQLGDGPSGGTSGNEDLVKKSCRRGSDLTTRRT